MNYKYYMPTRVLVGNECVSKNRDVFKTLGKKALIVTGARSAKLNGSEADVKEALEAVGIAYVIYDKVMSNPTIACAYEGADFAKANQVDFIIAIGGGSPMDAAKAMALLAAQEIKEEDLFSGQYEKVLPMAFIPTTAGTGSEVTQYSILTNDKAQTKTSIATDLIFPTVSLLDAKYMEQMGITTTINTAIDALSHAVEGMLSVRASVISDALAKESIRLIMSAVPKLLLNLQDTVKPSIDNETREILMEASLMAGMVIAQTGTTVVHAMGYSLTYFKDIDHGRANGLLLGSFLDLVGNQKPEVVDKILQAMNLTSVSQFSAWMDELFGRKETITTEEIRQYSQLALATKNVANSIVKPSMEEIQQMYVDAFK